MNTLITKALHLLPPEAAHRATLWALRNGLGPVAKPDTTALNVNVFGKTFSNPIGLAGGAEKKGDALTGWANMGFGFVETGTVTLYPRTGNPKPRIWRVGDGQGVINWMGLPGDGLEPFAANLEIFSKAPERARLHIGVSVGSPEGALDDFRKIASRVAPLADYITLNASCPNVAHEDNAVQAIASQIKAVKGDAGTCPVLLKIGPTRDAEVLREVVSVAMGAGAAGIVATNTVPFDKKSLLQRAPEWPRHEGKPVGGYSGVGLLDVACWMVAEIRGLIGKGAPIIGVGGIQTGADAMRVLKAGSNLIQLYTGFIYKGPALLDEIKAAITASGS